MLRARGVWAASAVLGVLLTVPAFAARAQADDPPSSSDRVIEFQFMPTKRAQIALWVERDDGTFVDTIRLTQSVAYRGIGNRPGASLMNSGFRWPYGRREGVLPIWAHRRASATGAMQFQRVIFQDRTSEGFASRTSDDASRDDYFCLSFTASTTRRDALDAVSCASVFNSDKGRYLTAADVDGGYAEPVEMGATGQMRPLSLESLYPPRRDVTRCTGAVGCADHADVALFQTDARRVMPNIDAITMATPGEGVVRMIAFDVPASWPNGNYVAYLEVNTEGDYNTNFSDTTHPTPMLPDGLWDYWAETYGYPYRGQPSVLYRVPFVLGVANDASSDIPHGYGSLEGTSGAVTPMGDGMITDDPVLAPGSGADRLRAMTGGARFRVNVVATNVCGQPIPPPECGSECSATDPCPDGFVCTAELTCIGMCDLDMPPPAVVDFSVAEHADEKQSHHWATLSFTVPEHVRSLASYEVRVSTSPIVDLETFMSAQPANAAQIDTVELVVPTDGVAGSRVVVDLGQLLPMTHYYVGIRAGDQCNDLSELAVAEVTTTAINFTTVSPCFVATAAYGTPLADDVGALRRFRDRHLATNAIGRAAIDAYHEVGPIAADLIRDDDTLRSITRAALEPVVLFARWLD